jgi:hypothetical protein
VRSDHPRHVIKHAHLGDWRIDPSQWAGVRFKIMEVQ